MATYDDPNILYSQPSVSYAGTLIINIEGIDNPIILNNITLIRNPRQDYSNATTIGVISIDYSPTGIITLEVGKTQAGELLNSLGSIRTSGEILVELV